MLMTVYLCFFGGAGEVPSQLGSNFDNMRRNQHSATSVPAPAPAQPPIDLSVVLVTGGYDHEIRFWEAWSGICSRTIARTGESGVRTQSILSRMLYLLSFSK